MIWRSLWEVIDISPSKHQIALKDLRSCPLFNGMGDTELSLISGLVEIRRLKDGEELAQEGQPGEEIFILFDGALEVKQKLTLFSEDEEQGRSCRDKMLIKLKSEGHPAVGEMSLFEDSYLRTATMRAIGDSIVGVIAKNALMKLAEQNQRLGFRLFYNTVLSSPNA